ncbi:FAD-dependent oxidoreductase [Solirubrobacter sp. CPCC 204708]|nr:FAD-dependent oxidoreductase [Solirubrobacter deserti]
MEELQVDVAVVGGGPAGMSAALAAERAGAKVALIDEYAAPGGQIWRRRYDEVQDAAPRSLPRAARELCAALSDSSVAVLPGASVWAAASPGGRGLSQAAGSASVELLLTGGPVERVRARAVVLATGAYDRPVAFPGWTLPGVMTAGGAQALAKGQGVVPGRRILLAGAGPFLLPVAAQLMARGAEVVAVAEATRRRDWLRVGPRMSAHPDRLREYAGYRRKVRRIEWGHVLVRAEGDARVRSATIAECGPDWAPTGRERTYAVDAVCTAYGFLPSVDLARALGCELRGDAVAHDEAMATSVPGVYVAGEASGVGGAELAQVEGELAGTAAAGGAVRPELRDRRARLAGFAGILGELFDPRPGLLSLARPETVLCRCEDVTQGAVDAAVADGATTMSALKIATRCGQGPCQGRTCERLVAARLPEGARFTGRAPVRPIPLEVLIKTAES